MRPSALAANFTHRLLLNRIAFPKVEQDDIASDVGNQAWPKPCSSMEIGSGRVAANVTNTFDRGYFSIKETITNVPRSSFSRCTAILKFCIFWSIFSDVTYRVRWKIYITFESFILTFFFSSEATRYKGKRRRHLFKLSSFPADNRVDKWKRSIAKLAWSIEIFSTRRGY